MIYNKIFIRYNESLIWHILYDAIILVSLFICVELLFEKREMYQIYIAITVFGMALVHSLILLYYLLYSIGMKPYWSSLIIFLHLVIVAFFTYCAFLFTIMLFGAPSVGD